MSYTSFFTNFPTYWALNSFSNEVFTLISSFSLNEISALDVMHNSEKSIPLVISTNFSFKLISNTASKLEPISLLALFSSILILQIFLTFINSFHFSI